MSHPSVEALDKVVLVISNNSAGERLFLGGDIDGAAASVSINTRKQDAQWFNQTWFAISQSQSATLGHSYYLKNVRTGKYLQAAGNNKTEAAGLVMAATTSPKALWYVSDNEGWARLTNYWNEKVFEFTTEADSVSKPILKANDPSNIQTQTWKYERISRSAQDVQNAMKANEHLPDKGTEYRTLDSCYLTLPPQILSQIWTKVGISRKDYRHQLFDCDDFSFTMKAAVARWGLENLRGDQFAILFGITFGEIVTEDRSSGKPELKSQRHAYNWFLKHDTLDRIVFFEPQTGLDSDDGWNYKGFDGIF